MSNINERFYMACYKGDLNIAKELYGLDPSILESPDRARNCFYYACINSHIHVAQWMAAIVEHIILFDPYLLMDICTMTNNQPIAEWVHNTFPVEASKDNHFSFRIACVNSPEIAEWLMKVYPYKYYKDSMGYGCVRNERDERWERRKYVVLFFYKASPYKDIWRKIIEYI